MTEAYLVVTGTTLNRSSSMCISITFYGGIRILCVVLFFWFFSFKHCVFTRAEATLLPNHSLPADLTVVEGQQADFCCIAQATQQSFTALTVAFLIKLPSSSSNLTQCFNYTFSKENPLCCGSFGDDRSCSGLVFDTFFSGDSLARRNHLTASWASVNLSLSGAEVVCAQASCGITQWAKTATLTVLPASPTVDMPVEPSSSPALGALAVLVVVLVGGVVLLATLIWWRQRRQQYAARTSQEQQLEQCELLVSFLSSCMSSSPFLTLPLQ